MDEKPDAAGELGRKLGKALKRAKPVAQRLAKDAGPIASKAGADALRFAREHEDEARELAQKVVRSRLRGPLGMVVDALVSQGRGAEQPDEKAKAQSVTCTACGVENALGSRFCSQCGARLTDA